MTHALQIIQDALQISELTLYTALSIPALCPVNSPGSTPDCQLWLVNSWNLPGNCLDSPPCSVGYTLSVAQSYGSPVCFPYSGDHCLVLLDVQYLKTIASYILQSFSVVSSRRLSPVPVTPLWLKAKIFGISIIVWKLFPTLHWVFLSFYVSPTPTPLNLTLESNELLPKNSGCQNSAKKQFNISLLESSQEGNH